MFGSIQLPELLVLLAMALVSAAGKFSVEVAGGALGSGATVTQPPLVWPVTATFPVTATAPAGIPLWPAGYAPWLGVLAVVPLVNLLLLWFVALAEWPASKVDA